METFMNVMVNVRSAAIVLLILAFTLMVLLGATLAVDELHEAVMVLPRKATARVEQNQLRRQKEEEALADYWTEFKSGTGFNNTGEIVNKFYWNEMKKEAAPDGSGSNR